MESLYRKYRPLTFESVVGQQHIVTTLERAVAEGRLSHAYLFCGPRGTGKTTMARILAKSLLCERADEARADGASGCMPDGTCEECRLIAEGTHPDVYELDAASRTGVDNVREEIINSVSFTPVRGAYKIYIIDEVHMLTTAAFNALLKTLEEPPEHVVFILCTTDPQKILDTILSRCQRLDFHRISNDDIVSRLRHICEQEGFTFEEDALRLVAKHARGGMRDALSTLEQLSVFGDGSVTVSDARALLGEVSSVVLSQFSRGIAARDVSALFGLVRSQVEAGEDLMELTRDLVAHVRDVYMVRVAGAHEELFDGPQDLGELTGEAEQFETADRLARVLTVLDDAALEMRSAADTRLVLEIALTKLARPEADLTLEALAERLERLEARVASGVPSAPIESRSSSVSGAVPTAAAPVASSAPAAPMPATSAAPTAASAPAPAQGMPPASAPAPSAAPAPKAPSATLSPMPASPAAQAAPSDQTEPTPAVPAPAPAVPAARKPETSAAPSPAEVAAAAAPSTPAVTDPGELQRKWHEVVTRSIAAQPARGSLLQSSRAVSDDGTTLTIGFPAGSTFAVNMLGRPDAQAVIMPQVCAVFGSRSLHYVMGEASAPKQAAPAAPAPVPAPAPEPASVSSSEPAPAPESVPVTVPASTPAPASSSAPAAEQPAAPSPAVERVPEAVSAPAPEDDWVPYDDAAAYAYDDDLPPFDMPAPTPAPAAAPTVPAASTAPAAPTAPAPAPVEPEPASTPVPAFATELAAAGAPVGDASDPAYIESVLGGLFGESIKVETVDGARDTAGGAPTGGTE